MGRVGLARGQCVGIDIREDSLLGYVDSGGVVEIYFVFVVHSCVIGTSKLAATE
jgi:hypothetical protein